MQNDLDPRDERGSPSGLAMERIRDYGGFIVWFMGLGYLAGWAAAPDRLAAMPASVHAIGLTALAFLPWRAWVWWKRRGAANAAVAPAVTASPSPPFTPIKQRRPAPPPKRNVKPRNHFGLRGVPH